MDDDAGGWMFNIIYVYEMNDLCVEAMVKEDFRKSELLSKNCNRFVMPPSFLSALCLPMSLLGVLKNDNTQLITIGTFVYILKQEKHIENK